jgi:hypothetical protein
MNHNKAGHNFLFMGGNASWHPVRDWEAISPSTGSEATLAAQNVYMFGKFPDFNSDPANTNHRQWQMGWPQDAGSTPLNWSQSDSFMW